MLDYRAAIAGAAMILLVSWQLISADGNEKVNDTMPEIDCSRCHTCAAPTAKNPCLRSCPSLTMTHIATEHEISEAPETIVLDKLASQYQPVRFDHREHADMAEMGIKCATCHHYSPVGKIPSCRECHGGIANPNNLAQPALKGAYHRLCISCHREWSHDTKCILCHLPANSAVVSNIYDSTDFIGIAHPLISEPDKKVYHTPYPKGAVVTFYHKEHIELYGLRCVNCHQEENCGYCHDMAVKATKGSRQRQTKTMQEIHATCNNCHADDRCDKCHGDREKPPFSHASTGWELGRFHNTLDCRACHPTGKPIAQMDSHCSSCHGGWNQDNFDHSVTGLALSETHREIDCDGCHREMDYNRVPDCSDCHDDGRLYQEFPPGRFVNR